MSADYRSIIDSVLVKRLFTEHLDGLILINCKTQTLLKVSDEVTGKLMPLVKFDDTPYDTQVDNIIAKKTPLRPKKSKRRIVVLPRSGKIASKLRLQR